MSDPVLSVIPANPNLPEFDSKDRSELREGLGRSAVGNLIRKIVFGYDDNWKDVASRITYTNFDTALAAMQLASQPGGTFIDAGLGTEHVSELRETSSEYVRDFRSVTVGANRLSSKSLQINFGINARTSRADLDRYNPAQSPIDAVMHFLVEYLPPKLNRLFKK